MAPIMSLMAAMLGPAPLPSSSGRRVQRRARCVLHKFSNDHANTDRNSGAQAKSDLESMIRELMEAFELIDMCREQGICYCKHGLTYSDHAKDRLILERIIHEAGKKPRLYLHWSVEKLKNEVKLHNIKLRKKRTRLALIGVLEHFDPDHTFRLMDLPAEVRLCIYGMALDDGRGEDMSPHDVIEPVLLLTARKIRSEAILVFYGLKYLRSGMPSSPQVKGAKPGGCFPLGDKAWLEHVGPDKIGHLRHIRMTELFDEYDLHVDLASRSASAWRIPFGNEVTCCPCARQEKWTLMQWREHMAIRLKPEDQKEIFDNIEKCTEIVNKVIQDFQALCVDGEKLEPTIAGLEILAMAAKHILDSRSMWTFAGVDFSGIRGFNVDNDQDDDNNDDDNDDEEESDDDEN
ncbi:hypothetical protein E4T43_01981 [Aureobasidium subglaciale]|nr:hypothetical protein E4T43_01981 [Aureobasidium subglaciale]